MIDLMRFCGVDDCRTYMRAPWRQVEGICASNGHILVIIPDDGRDVPACGDAHLEQVTARFSAKGASNWIPGASIRLPAPVVCPRCEGSGQWSRRNCERCDGEGVLECDLGHEHDCETCNASGSVPCQAGEKQKCGDCGGWGESRYVRVPVGAHEIDARYARLILTLPEIEFGAGIDEGVMPFRFAGGRGVVMPMRAA